ncbi:putative transport protein YifK [Sporomusa rhizae]|uniref:amino acid permease n=1 Tax=Sporomusa rhizae TaxID=357999 RepID=UPI00352A6F6C
MAERHDSMHENLNRDLKERHIQLIAIGGAIGVGLFLGSASAIKAAGPSIILAYALGGVFVYFIMRALGEMTVENPVSGSFSAYAHEYIGPLAGYLTGWSYWLFWGLVCMIDPTAIGVYINYWWPEIPQWVSALVTVVLLTGVNLTAVKAFGEFEFWFALIKVITIVAMIIFGLAMIIFGLGNGGVPVGISNLWTHGGFFPHGMEGTIIALVMVAFAFFGMELIGVTAGEAANPEKTIPSAINKVFWRVLIFYVGALFVILSIYPWEQMGTIGSPFVIIFAKLGIPAAAGIINFVVITASASACNSGIYVAGRMLYNLSLQGKAPKCLSELSKSGVPRKGILASVVMMLISVVLNYLIPAEVFNYLVNIITFVGVFAWFMIMWAQLNFRKRLTPEQVAKLKFPMRGFPYCNWLTMAFLVFVIGAMALDPNDRISLIVGPIWLIIATVAYYAAGYNKIDDPKRTGTVENK